MKDAEKRVVAARADRDALSALSAAGISGSARTSVNEVAGKLVVTTEVSMTPGQELTYTDLSSALRYSAGRPGDSITQLGSNKAVIRWADQ